MTTTDENGWYAMIYLMASIAVIGNTFIVFYFIFIVKSMTSVTTRLLFLLHFASILEAISTLPQAFTGCEICCQIMGAFHYYFGLLIFDVDFCLSILCTNYLLYHNQLIEKCLNKYSLPLILLCSLITFLPIITNSYGINNNIWCSLSFNHIEDDAWSFIIFYGWAFIAWITSVILLIHIYYQIRHLDIQTEVLNSVVAYVIVTFFAICPRLFIRFSNFFIDFTLSFEGQFLVNGGVYLSLILYCICFWRNRNNILEYEEKARIESSANSWVGVQSLLEWVRTSSIVKTRSSVSKPPWMINPLKFASSPRHSEATVGKVSIISMAEKSRVTMVTVEENPIHASFSIQRQDPIFRENDRL